MATHRAYPAAATWSNYRAPTALAALLIRSVLFCAWLVAECARWDLYELAGARHGRWTSRCPCPMYSIEQQSGLPRRPVLNPNGYVRMESEVRVYVLTETPTLHGPLGAIGEPSGTIAARRGLRSSDLSYSRSLLGSLQAVAARQWDEASGYGAVEASRGLGTMPR
jgi:hypothetical protein